MNLNLEKSRLDVLLKEYELINNIIIKMKKELIFIAEIGLNHNGNFDLCFELIKQAKFAGANIVKLSNGVNIKCQMEQLK